MTQPISETIKWLNETKDRIVNSRSSSTQQGPTFTESLILEVRALEALLDFTDVLLKYMEREAVMEDGIRDHLRYFDRELARTNPREINWEAQKIEKLKSLSDLTGFYLTCPEFNSALHRARMTGQLGKGKMDRTITLVQRLADTRTKLWEVMEKKGIET